MTDRLRKAVQAHHKALQDLKWADKNMADKHDALFAAKEAVVQGREFLWQAQDRYAKAKMEYDAALGAEPDEG